MRYPKCKMASYLSYNSKFCYDENSVNPYGGGDGSGDGACAGNRAGYDSDLTHCQAAGAEEDDSCTGYGICYNAGDECGDVSGGSYGTGFGNGRGKVTGDGS